MTSDWLTFFKPYFLSEVDAVAFVERCESINRDYRPIEELDDSTAKVMMHQTVRLVTLSEHMRLLRGTHDPLSLFFLIICAECVSKLYAVFKGEGKSREFVRRFFSEHVSATGRDTLAKHFKPSKHGSDKIEDIVDILYAIRCDVVHEGRYWGFSFPTNSCPVLNLHPKHKMGQDPIRVSMSIDQLRDIVVRGCIAAVIKKLDSSQPAGVTPPGAGQVRAAFPSKSPERG